MANKTTSKRHPAFAIPRKRRLVVSVTLLLILGFLATSLASYMVSGSALRDQIQAA